MSKAAEPPFYLGHLLKKFHSRELEHAIHVRCANESNTSFAAFNEYVSAHAAPRGNIESVESTLGNGGTLWHVAVQYNVTRAVPRLLELNIDPFRVDVDGATADQVKPLVYSDHRVRRAFIENYPNVDSGPANALAGLAAFKKTMLPLKFRSGDDNEKPLSWLLEVKPCKLFNTWTKESFWLLAYKSGDAMYPETKNGEVPSAGVVTAQRERHQILMDALVALAGAERRVRFFNLDGRGLEAGQGDVDAERRSELERSALTAAAGGNDARFVYTFLPMKDRFKLKMDAETSRAAAELEGKMCSAARGFCASDVVVLHCSSSKGRTGGIVQVVLACIEQGVTEADQERIETKAKAMFRFNGELSAHDRPARALAAANALDAAALLPPERLPATPPGGNEGPAGGRAGCTLAHVYVVAEPLAV